MWTTMCATGQMVRYDVATQQFETFSSAEAPKRRGGYPHTLRINPEDPEGLIWYTDAGSNSCFSIHPETHFVNEYKLLSALRPVRFMDRGKGISEHTHIWWFNEKLHEPDWAHEGALGCWLNGDAKATGHKENGADVLILFNTLDEAVEFHLPDSRKKSSWRLGLTSQAAPPSRPGRRQHLTLAARSLNVWTSA